MREIPSGRTCMACNAVIAPTTVTCPYCKKPAVTPGMRPCKTCKRPIAKSAKTCPQCGAKNKTGGAGWVVLLILIGLGVAGWASMSDQERHKAKRPIEYKVLDDSIAQYEMARDHGGNKMDICIHAGIVSAAALQANDQDAYAKWKQIEEADCKRAGLRR